MLGWQPNLRSANFRAIWIFVLLSGLVFASSGFKPLKVILFAQVANGILLPIIAGFLLWTMNDRNLMGTFINSHIKNISGYIILAIALMLGLKSIVIVF